MSKDQRNIGIESGVKQILVFQEEPLQLVAPAMLMN